MADLEDGYTRIANELMEEISRLPLNGRQFRVLACVIRKTYGYQKNEDDMSASQISDMCGIARNHVTTILNELERMNVISKRKGAFGMVIAVNKKHKTWGNDSPDSGTGCPESGTTEKNKNIVPISGQGVPNQDFTSPESGTKLVPNLGHTKENPKENQQKTCAKRFARFWAAYPKKKSKGTAEKTFQKINPSEQLLDAMLVSIEQAKTSDDWKRNAGQFIPYPASWLNAKGWEDDVGPAEQNQIDSIFAGAI